MCAGGPTTIAGLFAMLARRRTRERGLTLVELMIAIAVALFVMAGVLAVFQMNLKTYTSSADYVRLNQEMRAVMHLITRDLRRAGYWANGTSQIGVGGAAFNNPFYGVDTSTVGCVLFAYDLNKNGTADTAEQFGFLFDAGSVKMHSGHLANSCAPSSDWEALNDVDVTEVTNLTFTPATQVIDLDGTGPRTSVVKVRSVSISVSGRLRKDPAVVATINESVRIRNDGYTD